MKTIGICAHSYEGGTLCFLTVCREGAAMLGPHMHPNIVLSAIPMGLSMPGWEANDYDEIAKHLKNGVDRLAKAGAKFFICPDNTAHIVLERVMPLLPIPGLHIADVVCQEIVDKGWKKVALLGTNWTMNGPVYFNALSKKGLTQMVPDELMKARIDKAIFEELCQGVFLQTTVQIFLDAIGALKDRGAECVILGCTEIPLIINAENSPLPILDTTRLLAKKAVNIAISEDYYVDAGWIKTDSVQSLRDSPSRGGIL